MIFDPTPFLNIYLCQTITDPVTAPRVGPVQGLFLTNNIAGAALQAVLVDYIQPLRLFIKGVAFGGASLDASMMITGPANLFIYDYMWLRICFEPGDLS